MKAVIGVGYMKQCLAGIDVFARLKFPNAEAVLVHAVEPVLPDGGFLPASATNPIADVQKQRQEDGEARMAEIAAELKKSGIGSTSTTRFGSSAHEITGVAQEVEADMIVCGSGKKGNFESFIMGSVTRALVTDAKRCILIGKQQVEHSHKINIVYATDHSDYADRCIEHLVNLAPAGIGAVTVVSANTVEPDIRDMLDEHNRATGEGKSMTDILEHRNKQVCEKFSAICDSTESVVIQGHVNDVINATMEKSGADLLVLGAHGHGFLERLVIGSTAMHMVGNEPWNVLVLRL